MSSKNNLKIASIVGHVHFVQDYYKFETSLASELHDISLYL